MITIQGLIGIITGITTTGDTITAGDGITGTIASLIFITGVIITIIVIVSLILQVYLELMAEEEKK